MAHNYILLILLKHFYKCFLLKLFCNAGSFHWQKTLGIEKIMYAQVCYAVYYNNVYISIKYNIMFSMMVRSTEQCGWDSEWCVQDMHELPETGWGEGQKHRRLAGARLILCINLLHPLVVSTCCIPLLYPLVVSTCCIPFLYPLVEILITGPFTQLF